MRRCERIDVGPGVGMHSLPSTSRETGFSVTCFGTHQATYRKSDFPGGTIANSDGPPAPTAL
jgi:hypothetical protein